MTDDLVNRLRNGGETCGIDRCKTMDAERGCLCAIAADEIVRLREKCDKQAMILRRLAPEKFPDTLFISGVLGKRDQNNMPEKLMVVPAYGVDFCYIYEYNGKTMGTEW
jgi:hypothetical protein